MRKAVSKKLRFEVFKRDSFKCQYCGESAPDVILHVDHINPVANGGDNDLTNLITSCAGCNSGKGARKLSDDTAVKKQKKQLDELNARREQMEMVVRWRDEMQNIDNDRLGIVCKRFCERLQIEVRESHRIELRRLLKRYDLDVVLASIDASADQYLEPEGDWYTQKSLTKTINYIPKICPNKQLYKEKPYMENLHHIAGKMKFKFPVVPSFPEIVQYLETGCLEYNLTPEVYLEALKICKDWEHFTDYCCDNALIDTSGGGDTQNWCDRCGECPPFTLYKVTGISYLGETVGQEFPIHLCSTCIIRQDKIDRALFEGSKEEGEDDGED